MSLTLIELIIMGRISVIQRRDYALAHPKAKGAAELIQLLEETNLIEDFEHYHAPGLSNEHSASMNDIVNRGEVTEHMLRLQLDDRPPLFAADPLFQDAIENYCEDDILHHLAGKIVAARMRQLGFAKLKGRTRPATEADGCAVNSGVTFAPR